MPGYLESPQLWALAIILATATLWFFTWDWPELIKAYGVKAPDNFEFRHQFVNIGWVYYHGTLNLDMREEGIYFRAIPPFKALPPLFGKTLLVPWGQFNYGSAGQGHYRIMPQNVNVRIRSREAIERIDKYLTRT